MTSKLNTFQKVRELTGWHAVAYAATLTERMKPNFQLFCETAEFDDEGQFHKSLESIWQWLSRTGSKINFALQLEKIEDVTPDAAEHDSFGVYPAIDAAISLAAIMSLITNDEPQGAVIVSKLSQGSVEAFVELVSDQSLSAQEIKEHPLMQWEVAFQNELVQQIVAMPEGAKSVKVLREMATSEGVSNIGIEINSQ
ncbi:MULTISPECIES: YjaG family protein [Alteromonadaceae]|uniref:YjaG family protein n=1 Tax=Alteromonadaceae TaxID=72275 RepID=UPI001C088A72|nr:MULTISPECIES: YjaG family protein [Aliiglaciecola]MBU2878885.1 YjaG family protein [Aliiglaciecola lipolytica]MDO6712968.1 YjaG family protein [Aliiglaciecola sp. 2_MG-2023]MDO6754007.1 YjaG family protein [Aliiglaciecola sp. 1_MG-2023]